MYRSIYLFRDLRLVAYTFWGSFEMVATRVITLRQGRQLAWLTVYADGRLRLHAKNDGHAFLRHGAQPREDWIDVEDVARDWPHGLSELQAALVELQNQNSGATTECRNRGTGTFLRRGSLMADAAKAFVILSYLALALARRLFPSLRCL
jgi:hypothetical protein